MATESFEVKLKLLENYIFELDFGEFGDVISDEPEPLGQGEGPNPVNLLAASVANCLCASLLFASRKYKQDPGEVRAVIKGEPVRDGKRLRVKNMSVAIYLEHGDANNEHLQKALNQFEDFCVVTQSVREGIDVDVQVFGPDNTLLK